MARVTVEDCIKKVPNRFELILSAAERVRHILSGAPLTIEDEKNKKPVLVLREIAAGTISHEQMQEAIIKGYQHHLPFEEDDDDILEAIAHEQDWILDPESKEMLEEIDEDDLTIIDGDAEEETEAL